MELGIFGSDYCVTSCNCFTSDASIRLGLLYAAPAPTACCRWLPGAAPARLPCGSCNLLRLNYLRANYCTFGFTMKVTIAHARCDFRCAARRRGLVTQRLLSDSAANPTASKRKLLCPPRC